MTFLLFFLMALLGLAIYYTIALQKFNSETPALGFGQTFIYYFKNKIWAFIANILVLIFFTIILAGDSTGWFMKFLTAGSITGDTPIQFYFISGICGFLNQALFSQLIGKRNPIAGFEYKQ